MPPVTFHINLLIFQIKNFASTAHLYKHTRNGIGNGQKGASQPVKKEGKKSGKLKEKNKIIVEWMHGSLYGIDERTWRDDFRPIGLGNLFPHGPYFASPKLKIDCELFICACNPHPCTENEKKAIAGIRIRANKIEIENWIASQPYRFVWWRIGYCVCLVSWKKW